MKKAIIDQCQCIKSGSSYFFKSRKSAEKMARCVTANPQILRAVGKHGISLWLAVGDSYDAGDGKRKTYFYGVRGVLLEVVHKYYDYAI